MASETSICNKALRLLRAGRISAMDEASEAGEWCRDVYYDARDALIAEYPWNFATMRTQLAASGDTPSWGFDYSYALPAAPTFCLRVLSIGEPGCLTLPYKVEGRLLVTDESAPLRVQFLARVEDTSLFPPLFVEALAARMAVEGAWRFTGSAGREASLSDQARLRVNEARRVDAQEGTPDAMIADDWLRSRY